VSLTANNLPDREEENWKTKHVSFPFRHGSSH